jgi:hypothetical protein
LKYLTHASINNKISKEVITNFYEFGYFRKESIIDTYIKLAKSSEEILNVKKAFSAFEVIEKIRNDIVDLYKKSSEILDAYNSIKKNIDDFEQNVLQQVNSFTTKIEGLSAIRQHNIESISKECSTRYQEMQEYMELLGVTLDENIHTIAELRTSYHQLAVRDTTTSDTSPLSHLAPDTTNNVSVMVSPTTTPPIERCDDFLQYRLLPALAAWVPDIRLHWAELFHHAVRA